jgi:glutamine amidotransferase
MNKTIGIIDYGMGNIGSVSNSLNTLNARSLTSNKVEELEKCDALILPGVGCFKQASLNLDELELRDFLTEQVVKKKTPFLGICLGLQLLAETSQEQGESPGLGWIKGHVKKIESKDDFRVPHVGWNNTSFKDSKLFKNIPPQSHFYYDHSYQYHCEDSDSIVATCQYGVDILSAIEKDNIFATQFHPEKSQINGLRLLKNFLNYVEEEASC